MKKVLLVATVQSHIAQFHKPLIQWLENSGYQVDIAARDNLDTKPNLHLDIPGTKFDVPFERSPFNPKNIKAYFKLKQVIDSGDYEIVHCNTPVGGILTRLAANRKRKKGETKVIYEAHGFHFFKGGPKKNWLLWYPIEKLFAHFTDTLLTINLEDYTLAQNKMNAGRVAYVSGVGIDLQKFAGGITDKAVKREELGIPYDAKLLLSVGELNRNKNHEIVMQAIQGMDIYYLIAGNGPLRGHLENTVEEFGLTDRVKLLGYRRDIRELCAAADVFVLPSIREGLPVALMEAMAGGMPVVCSEIRGNTDLIDNNGGIMFDPYSVETCRSAIVKMLSSDLERYGQYNAEKVKRFSQEAVIQQMQRIYWELLNGGK